MVKTRKILGIIVIMALLLSSSVPFVTHLATAAGEEGEPEESTPCEACGMGFEARPIEEVEPEEDTSGVVSTGPVHMVLEDLVLINQAEPVEEPVPLSPGWQTIMSDGFEEAWPGDWSIWVGPADAYWGDDNVNPNTGSWSAFCARDGSEGVIPFANYPNDMSTWMDYGPFSLADATDATLDYWLWLDAESGFDAFYYMASVDGTNWYGSGWTGYSDGWVAESFDLTNVDGFGDMCGQPNVWITFGFESNESNPVDYYGAFVDDVVLQKYVPDAAFDLEAVEVYLSTQAGDPGKVYVVDTPTVGQDVYFHFKYECVGSGTTPSFRTELNLDGTMFCFLEEPAIGGYIIIAWCLSPWTATAGAHTVTGVLDVNDDVSESNEANNEAEKSWGGAPPEAAWTFMVYLDGDNDLEESEIASFNRMEFAANNPDVNVIVQFDRIPGYDSSNGDWTTTRRYEVKYDTDLDNFAAYTLGVDYWDLGELNMADPTTLSDFVLWAKANYPADHYCLVPSNHGGGWKPMARGLFVPRGIIWDDTSGDYMSTAELDSALNVATSGGTEKLDVLFLNACLMQMIEVGYQVKDYSQYLVASEHLGWGPGPYHDYVSYFTSTTTAEELAIAIVNYYHSWFTGTYCAHTMSATDLSQYGLASVVDDFAQKLTTGLSTYWTEIESSRAACQEFCDPSFIDLYHFAFLIDQNIADVTIQTAAQAVMTAVSIAVIAEAHENGSDEWYHELGDSHGISIYFPASESDPGYSNYNDGNLTFVADKGWDEFLAAFFTVNNPPNAPDSPLCEGATNPSGVTDPTPEFSWTFSDPDGGDTQGAYQILVASTSENLSADNGDMWDSGKVSSSASEVSYAGTTLAESQTYYWKVKTWDNLDAEGPYCGEQQFTTGTFPTGLLRVETSPAVPTRIFVDGIPRNDWGLDYVKMPPGEYTLSFTDVPGYLAPDEIEVTYDPPGGGPTTQPLSEPIEILPDTITEVTVNFVQLGNLWVRTDPAVPTIISLNGAPPANNWGFWVDLLPGDYDLSISDVVGYATPAEVEVTYPGEEAVTQPISEPITVSAGGTTEVVIHFIQLGNLKVETSPVLPATIFVDGNPMNDWGFWLNLEAGEYTVSFQEMDGYTTPPPVVVTITPGVTTYVIGDYIVNP